MNRRRLRIGWLFVVPPGVRM